MIYREEFFLTVLLLLVTILFCLFVKNALKRFSLLRKIEPNRRKIILNLSYLFIYVFSGSILLPIWGVDLRQFTVFISSLIAILGVGLFAHWSILSNLTASVILFFNHPVRIGDRICILDKEFDLTGEVKDITGFYFLMKTDDGQNIILPNSLVIQKGIEILEKPLAEGIEEDQK